jgi:hypothetical protein
VKPKFKKRTAIAVGFVGSVLWGTTCILESQFAIAQLAGGMFIVNELSKKCLDVAGNTGSSVANGTQLVLNECEISGFNSSGGITDQKWEFIRGGFIRNKLWFFITCYAKNAYKIAQIPCWARKIAFNL